MTTIIITNTSSGAPAFSGTAGATISLLDFCLVTTLGWTKPFTGTNLAAYKQPSGTNGFYLYVDDTQAQYARLRGYEAMTSISAGTGPFPTDTISSGGYYLRKSEAASSTARPWYFITDGKIFHLVVGTGSTTPAGWVAGYNYVYSFGDAVSAKAGDAFATVLVADINSPPSASTQYPGWLQISNASYSAISNGHTMPRSHTQIGGAIGLVKVGDPFGALGNAAWGNGNMALPSPIGGGIELARAFVMEASIGRRARIQGAWCWQHSAALLNPGDTFSGASGSDLAGKTFIFFPQGASYAAGSIVLETSDTWNT